MNDSEKALFEENNQLKRENGFLKQENTGLRKRIAELEKIPEFEHIKEKAANNAGTLKSSEKNNPIDDYKA